MKRFSMFRNFSTNNLGEEPVTYVEAKKRPDINFTENEEMTDPL